MKKTLIVLGAAAAVVAAGTFAYAATTGTSVSCTRNVSSGSYTITCPEPVKTKTVTTTVTVTPPPTSTPPPVTDPPPPPTDTNPPPSGNYSCSEPIGGVCGAYNDNDIPMSNGFNTYVTNQAVNVAAGGKETVNANSPSDWQLIPNLPSCGGCVQTFPDVQQLMNDWGNGGWGNCGGSCTDTPLASLSTLKVNYTESSPTDAGSSYEFAPDVWDDNYGADVMFWVDTHGRCNEGAFGGTVLGNATLDGQNWTVHRYGGAGAEIIFVLDGAGGSGTCAQQSTGTVDIKAGYDWLVANVAGFNPNVVLSQLNTGWEVTQGDGAPFTVTSYSITAS